LLKLQDLTSV